MSTNERGGRGSGSLARTGAAGRVPRVLARAGVPAHRMAAAMTRRGCRVTVDTLASWARGRTTPTLAYTSALAYALRDLGMQDESNELLAEVRQFRSRVEQCLDALFPAAAAPSGVAAAEGADRPDLLTRAGLSRTRRRG